MSPVQVSKELPAPPKVLPTLGRQAMLKIFFFKLTIFRVASPTKCFFYIRCHYDKFIKILKNVHNFSLKHSGICSTTSYAQLFRRNVCSNATFTSTKYVFRA